MQNASPESGPHYREPAPLPPAQEDASKGVPLGVRVGGVALVLAALVTIAEGVLTLVAGGQHDPGHYRPPIGAAPLIDLWLGFTLWRATSGEEEKWRKALQWVLLRLTLGGVLFLGLSLAQRNYLEAGLQALLCTSLLGALVGRAGKLRLALSGLVFGALLVLSLLGLAMLGTGRNPLGEARGLFSSDFVRPSPVELRNDEYGYRLPLRPGWRVFTPTARRRLNQTATDALEHPGYDASFTVIAERIPWDRSLTARAALDASVAHLRESLGQATEVGALDLTEPRRAGDASAPRPTGERVGTEQLFTAQSLGGIRLRVLAMTSVRYGVVLQVQAFSAASAHPRVREEQLAMLRAFEHQERPTLLAPEGNTEPVPTALPDGVLRDAQGRYECRVPSGWRLRHGPTHTAEAPHLDARVFLPFSSLRLEVAVDSSFEGELPGNEALAQGLHDAYAARPGYRALAAPAASERGAPAHFEFGTEGDRAEVQALLAGRGHDVYQFSVVGAATEFDAHREALEALLASCRVTAR